MTNRKLMEIRHRNMNLSESGKRKIRQMFMDMHGDKILPYLVPGSSIGAILESDPDVHEIKKNPTYRNWHMFLDKIGCGIMESFNTKTDRNIVVCKIRFGVHSYSELKTIINHISTIVGVDEVRRLDEDDEL